MNRDFGVSVITHKKDVLNNLGSLKGLLSFKTLNLRIFSIKISLRFKVVVLMKIKAFPVISLILMKICF